MTDTTSSTWESAGSSLDGEAIAGLLVAVRTARNIFLLHTVIARLEGRDARANALEDAATLMETALTRTTGAAND